MSAVLPTLYYFKKFTPQLKVKVSYFSKERVVELSKMSIWILISQVGVLLLGNIDLYLVNNLLGSKETGEYAIVLQFTSIFKTFSILLSSIFIPISMIYYANNEIDKLTRFTILASKLMLIGLMVALAGLVGFSEYLLDLWLSPKYIYLSPIISFSMLFFIFSIPVIPLFNVTVSFNKVKIPALMVICLGIVNMVSIYILTTQTDLGLWAIVSVKLILEIIFAVSILIYVSIILQVSRIKFISIILVSIILFVVLYGIILAIKYFIVIDSIWDLLYIMIVAHIILVPTMAHIILSREEKILLVDKFKLFKKLGW
jgi:O-antigen/teichoic acid export membrane protein